MDLSICSPWAVIPVLTGPLQVLLAILPGLLVGLFTVVISLFKPSVMKQGALLLWRLKLPLAATAVLAFGGIWAVRVMWPVRAATAADLRGGDWPMFRGGLTRRGITPNAIGPTRGGLNWVWKDGSEIYSSPAIVGKRVYISTAVTGSLRSYGQICCLDADSGTVLWQAAPTGYRPTFSSPAVSGSYLVCGEGLHITKDARVICLDLTPGREGQTLWTLTTNSHVECTPLIHAGRVYVGAGDDGYYCIDLKPENGQAKVHWHVPGKKYPDAETALAVHEGKVYVGLGNGGKALCVLDAATGTELHRLLTPYPVFGPPAIAGSKLFVGMGNGDYVYSADEIRESQLERLRERGAGQAEIERAIRELAPGGEVWCIRLSDMQVEWKHHVAQTVLGAVGVTSDALYFGSRDGQLHCLDHSGKSIGQWHAHAPIIASPALTDSHVYIVTNAGMLFGLERNKMEPVWEFRLGTEPLFVSSPTVSGGRVYVGSKADGLLCVGEPGAPETPRWPGPIGGPGAAGVLDGSAVPMFAEPRATFAAGNSRTPAAAAGGIICVAMAGETHKGVACLKVAGTLRVPFLADGTRSVPATLRPRWIFPAAHGVHASPAIHGERVFFVDGVSRESGRHLHCVSARDGKLLWKAAVEPLATGVFIIAANSVFVQDSATGLSQYSLDGAKAWTKSVGRMKHPPCVAGWIVVAAVDDPPALVALDRGVGTELWRVPLAAPATAMPVVAKTTLYLGMPTGLEARSLIDGRLKPGWPPHPAGVSGDFAVRPRDIAYVSSTGELIVLDRANGKQLGRVAGALPGFPPLVSRDAVLFVGGNPETPNIMQLTLGEHYEASIWYEGEALGRILGPMILADSQVYVGVAGKGLVQLGAAP